MCVRVCITSPNGQTEQILLSCIQEVKRKILEPTVKIISRRRHYFIILLLNKQTLVSFCVHKAVIYNTIAPYLNCWYRAVVVILLRSVCVCVINLTRDIYGKYVPLNTRLMNHFVHAIHALVMFYDKTASSD